MRLVVQRTSRALVQVDNKTIASIDQGLLVLVGITHGDDEQIARRLAEKVVNLRIFEDDEGKMNRSLLDIAGELLSVSQFTLYGDCRKGRRPNFMEAARPEHARAIYEHFNDAVRALGVPVQTGQFGAMMDVQLTNSGPVTLILEES